MRKSTITIRETDKNDIDSIIKIHQLAFGEDNEADLTVDLLWDVTARPFLSLIAVEQNEPIGHILFTRVYIDQMDNQQPLAHILAPLAVIPKRQNMGVGSLLIQEGIKHLKKMGSEMIFVLGHADYYPKFGFIQNAAKFGYNTPFKIPGRCENGWMVQSLTHGSFSLPKGKVLCAEELSKPEYWRE